MACASDFNVDEWVAPHGITVEQMEWAPRCFILSREDGRSVTVDLETRIFGLGACVPRKWSSVPHAKFSGAGWKVRLLNAAIAHLQFVMDS